MYVPFLEVCPMRTGMLCIHRGYVWQNTWMWSSYTYLSLKCVICVLVCCAFTEVMFDRTHECDPHIPTFPWSVSYVYWYVVHSQRLCLIEHMNVILIYLPFLEVCHMCTGMLCMHRGYVWQNTWMWSSHTFLSLKCVICILVCCAFTEVMTDVCNILLQEGCYVATLCLQIQDPNQVYDAINLGRRIDVVWPDERMRARGGRSHWRDWLPERGMEGQVSTDKVK